jgi:PPP family 3-phenylpropionic acid transporter
MTISKKELGPGTRLGIVYLLFFSIWGISGPYLQIILRRLGYSPSMIGWFLGFAELVGIAAPIFIARIADHSGKSRPSLFYSGIGILTGAIFLVLLKRPVITLLSIVTLSLGLKTPIPVLDASIFKTIEKQKSSGGKALNYGTMRALGSLGFVIVTVMVQLIPGFDVKPPEIMVLALCGITILYILSLVLMPDTGKQDEKPKPQAFSFGWVDSTFAIGLVVIALGRLAMSSVNSFLSLYLTEDLGWNSIGAMYALAAAVEIPMMLFSWKIMRRVSPMGIVALGSAAIILRLLIYAIFPTKLGVITGQLLHSLCYGLLLPATVAFVNLKTPPAHRTTGMALLLSVGTGLPIFVGSAIGGLVVEAFGYRWLFASFTLFAAASLALYFRHKPSLTAVR